jgi:hypothetical protein
MILFLALAKWLNNARRNPRNVRPLTIATGFENATMPSWSGDFYELGHRIIAFLPQKAAQFAAGY